MIGLKEKVGVDVSDLPSVLTGIQGHRLALAKRPEIIRHSTWLPFASIRRSSTGYRIT